jgi:hypothetical protein
MPTEVKLITECPNFIKAWYLDDLTICDKLIEYFKNNPDRQVVGEAGDPDAFGPRVMPEIKDSTDIFFPADENTPVWQDYRNAVGKCVDDYVNSYPRCADTDSWGFHEFTNLQYYKPGGGYKAWHSERVCALYPYNLRHLVFMTYLNDVTDAGETEFFHQKIKVSPKKGLTLMWPADWTHFHRGIPSPTQDKYIMTGWLSFIQKDTPHDDHRKTD